LFTMFMRHRKSSGLIDTRCSNYSFVDVYIVVVVVGVIVVAAYHRALQVIIMTNTKIRARHAYLISTRFQVLTFICTTAFMLLAWGIVTWTGAVEPKLRCLVRVYTEHDRYHDVVP